MFGIKALASRVSGVGKGAMSSSRTAFGAAITLTGAGLGIYSEYYTTGREYGTGAAVVKGIGYSMPIIGGAGLIYDLGKGIGDYAYNTQKNKRISSFSSAGVFDPYGNMATMRQRSRYSLDRGRQSLSNEGYLFHW